MDHAVAESPGPRTTRLLDCEARGLSVRCERRGIERSEWIIRAATGCRSRLREDVRRSHFPASFVVRIRIRVRNRVFRR